MRKDILSLVSLLIVFSLLIACKKVVQLDLNNSSSQIVIQGNIFDQGGPFVVKISRSVNFYEPNVYPAVPGAKVVISNHSGDIDHLVEKSPGIYVTSIIQGVPGETYTLQVKVDGQSYTATSQMPQPVEIGAIYFQKSLFSENIYPAINFTDPPNTQNYYRLVYSINNIQKPDINVTDDQLSEGKIITYVIRPADDGIKFKKGDIVSIWLESVDQGVYEYFRTAGREGGQSASPANPTSNISNGALGYFNACAVRAHAATVP